MYPVFIFIEHTHAAGISLVDSEVRKENICRRPPVIPNE
jgi:hypothetical protein